MIFGIGHHQKNFSFPKYHFFLIIDESDLNNKLLFIIHLFVVINSHLATKHYNNIEDYK